MSVPNFRNLPAGTVLRFQTGGGNAVEVEVVRPITAPRYGTCLEVKVLSHAAMFAHPEAVVLQAADLRGYDPQDTTTLVYFTKRVPALERGFSVILDDGESEPPHFEIVHVEIG